MPNKKDSDTLLKQYEIMVNSSIQLTTWRQWTNGFFITLSTALITVSTYLHFLSSRYELMAVGIVGIVLSALWHETIRYFKALNNAKFQVIHAMEKSLPSKPFTDEWAFYKKEKVPSSSELDRIIPIIFGGIYIIILLVAIFNL